MDVHGKWSRRSVLSAAGLTAAAAVVGTPGTAEAAVPSNGRFDLAASLVDPPLLWKTPLQNQTVMQSFAWDPTNNYLYTIQCRNGEGHLGNLVVTARPGTSSQSYMVLYGFGHGVTLGIERASSTTGLYLWAESHSGSVPEGEDAFGTRISRVAWSTNGRVSTTSAGVQERTPPEAVDRSPRPIVDQKNNLLIVRYTYGSGYRFDAYPITDAAKDIWTNRVYRTDVPKPSGTSQGTTVYGGYVYLYYGNAYSSTNPYPGNTTLYAYKIVDGGAATLSETKLTEAYKSLDFREPEGLAVYKPRSTAPILGFGFASGPAGDRLATIAGKPQV